MNPMHIVRKTETGTNTRLNIMFIVAFEPTCQLSAPCRDSRILKRRATLLNTCFRRWNNKRQPQTLVGCITNSAVSRQFII